MNDITNPCLKINAGLTKLCWNNKTLVAPFTNMVYFNPSMDK